MKRNYTRLLLALTAVVFANVANAQISRHPLAFYGTVSNFYKDYVGMKFGVTAPSPSTIARDYVYTAANDGSGSGVVWGGYVTTPLVNVPVAMAATDSFVCSTLPAGSMAGKIALIWRGTCEFSVKAYEAQVAGAVAVVIINSIPGEGPVGMAAGTMGASVTIPVFMIGNLDGIGISAAYHTSAPGTVKMSITPWSKGLQNDLGFVPGGISLWHNGAIPAFQIPSTEPTSKAYKGLDGAFIANYGNLAGQHVKLNSTLKFTPTGGSSTTIHTGTVNMTPATFPIADSIWALFGTEYDLPGVTGTGKLDLTYSITSDSVDNFPGDNTATHTFYATDSVFSKGRYDVVNNHPIATSWTSWTSPTSNTLWGVPYFVKHGTCAALKDIQFSASTGPGPIMAFSTDFYIFKWVPSSLADSTMEQPELTQVGTTSYSYSSLDSSFEYFTTNPILDGFGNPVELEDSTWYYVAVELSGSSVSIGCDGEISGLPRIYGRTHVSGYHDLYQAMFPFAAYDLPSYPAQPSWAFPGGGGISGNLNSADSAYFHPQKGLIPALALRVTPYHAPIGNIISPAGICVGDTSGIMMTDTTTSGTWTTSGSGISLFAGINPAMAAMIGVSVGSTTISYSVSGSCGVTIATTTVTVTSTDAGTISGPSGVCVGSAISLSDAATGGTWSASNGNVSFSGALIVTGIAAGTTTISYNVFGICGPASATQVVTVNALPVPVISVSGGTLSTGTYSTYQWYVGTTTPISGATNATFEAVANGLYQVTVTDANGCTGTAAVNVTAVGVDNLYNVGNIRVYPNPANDVLNILGEENVSVKMYNALVQLVKEASGTHTIPVHELPAGIYFVKVFNQQGGMIYHNKIVKQ